MPWVVFDTIYDKYLYDRNKNKVIPIPDRVYDELISYQKNDKIMGLHDNKILKRLVERGYLHENKIKTIEHPDSKLLEIYSNKKIEGVTLQVTQDCNLRCEYCFYSGTYNGRSHRNKKMSKKIALDSIDFLMNHSSAMDKVRVGFYGGEPLLEINLIKDVVEYCKTKYNGRTIDFGLTTNGILLNVENADFLMNNNFNIMVSIDGPKDEHNKQRIFANGQGSFDIVYANLKTLYQERRDFFEKITINSVYNITHNFDNIKYFFENDTLISVLNSKCSFLSDAGLDNDFIYDNDTYIEYYKKKQFVNMVELMLEEQSDHCLFGNYIEALEKIHNILMSGELSQEKAHPGGPCMPGIDKPLIDVDGNIYPCEKVSENPEMQIGNIYNGYDYKKMYDFLNVAQMTPEKCKNCWAFLFCNICVVAMTDSKGLSTNKRIRKCNVVKRETLEYLKSIKILEANGADFQRYV